MSLTTYKVKAGRKKQRHELEVEAVSIWAALVLARVDLFDGWEVLSAEGGGERAKVLGECFGCGRFLLEVTEGEITRGCEFEHVGRKVSCGPDCPARAE